MPSHTPIVARRFVPALLLAFTLAACGAPTAPAPTATPSASNAASVDLSGIKTYLVGKTGELKAASVELKAISDRYYDIAKAANFDYATLAKAQQAELAKTIGDARAAWKKASPLYEQMEGIVAGTPSLAQFDVDMDAGTSGAEDPDNAVSFDLALPDGNTLPKPGNLFGVTESTLWATFADYRVKDVTLDVDGDGAIGFGDALPDANVLKGGVDELAAQAAKLNDSATAWQPTESDAFTALVVMVPTMSEYFDSWKNSRFIAGDKSDQRDFVAISRLADIQNILGSLQIVHQNVSPLIKSADASEDARIGRGLTDLKSFVADVYQQEQSGQRFNAEDADLLGKEAQDRATAITGQITQVAAKLNIKIQE
jgi:imelysin